MTETEESLAPLVDLYLDGSAMSSQVVEIIGGETPGAARSPERDATSLEEGDDEVFYEDEDASCRRGGGTPGASGSPGVSAQPGSGDVSPNNTEAAGGASPIQENHTGRDPVGGGGDSLTYVHRESGPPQHTDTAQHQERQTPPAAMATACAPALDSADHAESQTTGASLAEPQAQAEQVSLAEEGVQTEGVTSPREQTSPPEEEGPGQVDSEAEKVCEESQDELDRDQDQAEVQQSQDSLSLRGTQSLGRMSGHSAAHKKHFNHHTHSKYGTVSYRKIRRGNTRQKIEEFESMMMNI